MVFGFSPDQLVPVQFSHTLDVGFGNSIFVSGTGPELGSNDLTIAPKLTYNTGAVWRGTIGLPPQTGITYRFYNRSDSYANVGSPSNGTPIGSQQTTTTTSSSGGLPLATTKTLYYLSSWAQPHLLVETSPGIFSDTTMTNVAAGRSVAERRWRANGFGSPGRAVKFKLTDGVSGVDFAAGGALYETYLDVAWLQDGGIYNYEPAGGVSTSRIEVLPAVSSPQGLLSRQLRVYLPRGYDSHPTRRYPVLYMHDGQNLYGATGSGFPPVHWNVDGTLDRMTAHGQVRELIVVGIDNTADRNTEYVPPLAPPGGISNGKAEKYVAFVRDTLKPLIDAGYRTLTDAANTGVAGSSLGGIVSTYFGLEAPGSFSRIGALSPAYWTNVDVAARLTTEASLPAWRHYMDCGTAGATANGSPDGFNDCIDARDRMLRRGQVLNVHVLNVIGFGQQHNETAWQSRFPYTARFLFPIEDESNALVGATASVGQEWNLY